MSAPHPSHERHYDSLPAFPLSTIFQEEFQGELTAETSSHCGWSNAEECEQTFLRSPHLQGSESHPEDFDLIQPISLEQFPPQQFPSYASIDPSHLNDPDFEQTESLYPPSVADDSIIPREHLNPSFAAPYHGNAVTIPRIVMQSEVLHPDRSAPPYFPVGATHQAPNDSSRPIYGEKYVISFSRRPSATFQGHKRNAFAKLSERLVCGPFFGPFKAGNTFQKVQFAYLYLYPPRSVFKSAALDQKKTKI